MNMIGNTRDDRWSETRNDRIVGSEGQSPSDERPGHLQLHSEECDAMLANRIDSCPIIKRKFY
jgi:hypothetical protein